jgi:DNA polymerase-3 subunit epsilon
MAVDLSGMFGRFEEGTVVFIKGKYMGRSLDDIARTKPDLLERMLRADYFDDTKSIASEALRQAG